MVAAPAAADLPACSPLPPGTYPVGSLRAASEVLGGELSLHM